MSKGGTGVFKIALQLPRGDDGEKRGGMMKREVEGRILPGGIFGIKTGSDSLTHIPTGRCVGLFWSEHAAVACAEKLAEVDLPWDAKTMREWWSGSREKRRAAHEIVRRYAAIVAEGDIP